METINNYILLIILVFAFFLDLAMGDPQRLPHPVKIIGKGISILERLLRKSTFSCFHEKISGILLAVIIIFATFLVTYLIEKWVFFSLSGIYKLAGIILLVFLTASTIATKELLDTGLKIIYSVEEGKLDNAREYLKTVVGRDVDKLDEKGILRATIETLSENLSDGIIAPLLFFVIGGLPLAMAYKAVNTLDSMVGYKNERYMHFGWASARIDDIFNYIPARISGILIALTSYIVFRASDRTLNSIKTMWSEGKNHSSPNSGYPEAAIAGALGVRLGGASAYSGTIVEKPFIGSETSSDYLSASYNAIRIIRLSSFAGFILSILTMILKVIP